MENTKARNLISVFVITVMVASVFAIPVFSNNYKVDAASKINIKFNANSGKIGKAKTKTILVTKGKKIGTKLPAAKLMKKSGYTFIGWYTAKKGGTKIKNTTKMNKKKTYYAQWVKSLTNEEKKLLDPKGWKCTDSGSTFWYKFNSDRTFRYVGTILDYYSNISTLMMKGNWSMKNGTLKLHYIQSEDDGKTWSKWLDSDKNITLGSDEYGIYLRDSWGNEYYKGQY